MTKSVLTLDALRGEGREKNSCKAGRVIRDLLPEDQATLNDALSGPEEKFPSGRIVNALAGIGVFVTKDTIIKHRRGFCKCNPARR